MSDLVRGCYAVTSPIKKLTGGAMNATQGNLCARTNAEWLSVAGLADTATIVAATGVCISVAIPVEFGDVVSKINVLVGATAAGTPVNQWAALYSGIAVPAKMAQSADGTSGAIAASAGFAFTLATPQVITPANAPGGFVYASVMVKATTIPSYATVAVATAVGYQWFTNSPLFMAASHGSGLTATAPATIASPAAVATAPIIFLT